MIILLNVPLAFYCNIIIQRLNFGFNMFCILTPPGPMLKTFWVLICWGPCWKLQPLLPSTVARPPRGPIPATQSPLTSRFLCKTSWLRPSIASCWTTAAATLAGVSVSSGESSLRMPSLMTSPYLNSCMDHLLTQIRATCMKHIQSKRKLPEIELKNELKMGFTDKVNIKMTEIQHMQIKYRKFTLRVIIKQFLALCHTHRFYQWQN